MTDQNTQALQALADQVAAVTSVDESAIALITGIAAQLQAIANDPAAILAYAAQLQAENQKLSDAVIANTTAANG